MGLEVLLPLMSPELLLAAAPGASASGSGGGQGGGNKLARRLFSLLSYMMEVHPAQVRCVPRAVAYVPQRTAFVYCSVLLARLHAGGCTARRRQGIPQGLS